MRTRAEVRLAATAQSKAGKQALRGYASRVRLRDKLNCTMLPDPCVSASGDDR